MLKQGDGFILKNKSPSSGIRDAKIFPSPRKSAPMGHAPAFLQEDNQLVFLPSDVR
jgi:uncharacterized protein YbbK (DUF523 family)